MALAGSAPRVYDDFVPSHELVQKEDMYLIAVHLADFKKEQVKVKLKKNGKLITISGERQRLTDKRWSRFNKEFRLPGDCNTKAITAKLEGGTLYISLPRFPKANAKDHEQSLRPQEAHTTPSGDAKVGTRADHKQDDEQKITESEDKRKKEKEGSDELRDDEHGDEDATAVHAMRDGSRIELRKLKLKFRRLDFELYKTKQLVLALVVVIVAAVGLGFYLHYKLSPGERKNNGED
ncbi:protein RESTRICTED TEV MOVEMENT 2 [Canna indica]|uniref:Protein RESTRICTED TEV MOVEMENT 2 n=1 Tax=Canna indica TaxID=4628 RepID=A0AAQ3JT60_9LILI|nr:protein RESTRICTED TEV MOVEMENT 2 [Canna indica]